MRLEVKEITVKVFSDKEIKKFLGPDCELLAKFTGKNGRARAQKYIKEYTLFAAIKLTKEGGAQRYLVRSVAGDTLPGPLPSEKGEEEVLKTFLTKQGATKYVRHTERAERAEGKGVEEEAEGAAGPGKEGGGAAAAGVFGDE